MALSQARLRKLLRYNPRTGRWTWRVNGRGRFMRVGARAGTVTKNGRCQICIDRVIYTVGQLAVLYMTGRWPKRMVDHKNSKPSDNRWRNFREADHSSNGGNSRVQKNKMYSPLKGVTYSKRRDCFQAMIKVNYRAIWLGSFDTAKQAHAAYMVAARKYFGEFARAR